MKNLLDTGRLRMFIFMAFFQMLQMQNISASEYNSYPEKKALIILGNCNDSIKSTAAGNELYNLLGHFSTSVDIICNKDYTKKELRNFDLIFYIGLQPAEPPSVTLINDLFKTNKTIVWMNSGFSTFENAKDVEGKFGFFVGDLDQSRSYNVVKSGEKIFTRGGTDLFTIKLKSNSKAEIIATAVGDLPRKTLPYIVKSKNLYYIADIPYFDCSVTDRYLLFADILHDIMGENHPEEHKAIVRVEDVTPTRDPDRIRRIADILSQRNIPFLIGVVPFYVDPVKNIRISLSDKPELVAALKYCVSKGGSIVMHGVTHQYKGISAIDFEFWDGSVNKPIANESESEIENKIEEGINECAKNGIYPLCWETPHYAASVEDYKIVSQHFSSSVERLIVTDSIKYGQYFPYEIKKDIYGQKVYPEDLGFMPLISKRDSSELYVKGILNNAKGLLNVRDSYASFFFHPFVNLDYLKEITDGISNLGYKFVDLRKDTNWVKSKDLVILSGSQKFSIIQPNQLLTEIYYNKTGQVEKRIITTTPSKGLISRNIKLKPDEFYVAETTSSQSGRSIAEIKNNHNNRDNLNAMLAHSHDKN